MIDVRMLLKAGHELSKKEGRMEENEGNFPCFRAVLPFITVYSWSADSGRMGEWERLTRTKLEEALSEKGGEGLQTHEPAWRVVEPEESWGHKHVLHSLPLCTVPRCRMESIHHDHARTHARTHTILFRCRQGGI